jgi:hypothetical protein
MARIISGTEESDGSKAYGELLCKLNKLGSPKDIQGHAQTKLSGSREGFYLLEHGRPAIRMRSVAQLELGLYHFQSFNLYTGTNRDNEKVQTGSIILQSCCIT